MNNTLYELLWYFFVYSFLGWCAEIIYAAVKERKFMNKGLLNAPLCPVYGFSMLFCLIFLASLRENLIFLMLGCIVVSILMEFFAGAMTEKFFKQKWWDYSDYKYNIEGYVNLQFNFLCGIGAALFMSFVQPLFQTVLDLLPRLIGNILLGTILLLCTVDFFAVIGVLFAVRKKNRTMTGITDGMHQMSNRLGRAIFEKIQKRMIKAYPVLSDNAKEITAGKSGAVKSTVFAEGCSFHKLVWLFFIGAFLGDLTETIFCYITTGRWMSRSSVVYGPFSIVWGLGVVVLTMMLYKYKNKDDRYIFIFGTIVGGVYEYVCSVFTELLFGTVFWDYSKIPFNIGGRINLLYCFFWGLAAVLWIKNLYPFFTKYIEKVPMLPGRCLSCLFLIFMTFNMIISALALARYSSRYQYQEPANALEKFLDEQFPDERMERIYPNAIMR